MMAQTALQGVITDPSKFFKALFQTCSMLYSVNCYTKMLP